MEEMLEEVKEPGTVSGNTIKEPETSSDDTSEILEPEPVHGDTLGDTVQEPTSDDGQASEYIEHLESEYETLLDAQSDILERIDSLLYSLEEENSIQLQSSYEIPIKGYREWNYGIVVSFRVYPYGAGYWMDGGRQGCSEPEDFEEWYSTMSSNANLKDFYITTVTDDNGIEVYNYETYIEPEEPEPVYEIPIEGYQNWNYSITVYYKVYPYGAGYWMETHESFAEQKAFEEWYQKTSNNINLKDFYITSVTDDNGEEVYNYETYTEPEEPGQYNPASGEYLEILQSIQTELETISAADAEYYQLTSDYREEMLKLQTAESACSIITCVALFIVVVQIMCSQFFRRFK